MCSREDVLGTHVRWVEMAGCVRDDVPHDVAVEDALQSQPPPPPLSLFIYFFLQVSTQSRLRANTALNKCTVTLSIFQPAARAQIWARAASPGGSPDVLNITPLRSVVISPHRCVSLHFVIGWGQVLVDRVAPQNVSSSLYFSLVSPFQYDLNNAAYVAWYNDALGIILHMFLLPVNLQEPPDHRAHAGTKFILVQMILQGKKINKI